MTKNSSLLKTIHLLSQLVVYESYDFNKFLQKLLKLVLRLIQVDSCLIYFYDKTEQNLILTASKKSHKKLMGKIKMKKGEGITGWVAEHKKTVSITKKAYRDKRFKQFNELPEDRYESFLSVPILDSDGVVGVINFQNKKITNFTDEQIEILEGIVKIISAAFQKVVLEKQVSTLQSKLEDRKIINKAKGILMEKDRLSEKEAYDIIRKEAMKKRKAKREIAEAVLLVWG